MKPSAKPVKKALVIKLGELGDMVLAFPAFERIRQAHPKAHITLLTTRPFEALARSSPFFNDVETDGRPTEPAGWAALLLRLRRAHYDRVYDLQTDAGTNLIFQGLRPMPPPWSGTAAGCALPHKNRARAKMHPLERQAEQLQEAGIWPDAPIKALSAPPPDLSWILAKNSRQRAPTVASGQRPAVMMAPGGGDADGRWPIERYAELAKQIESAGFDIVVVGALNEAGLAHAIQRKAVRARDLTGRTDFAQIAALGARAALAVGNDIGALHLAAAAGAPTLALFSSATDPAVEAPRGLVTVLHAAQLKDLAVDTVARAALGLAQTPS